MGGMAGTVGQLPIYGRGPGKKGWNGVCMLSAVPILP